MKAAIVGAAVIDGLGSAPLSRAVILLTAGLSSASVPQARSTCRPTRRSSTRRGLFVLPGLIDRTCISPLKQKGVHRVRAAIGVGDPAIIFRHILLGHMLFNAQSYLWNAPWVAPDPRTAILVTVLAMNFIGDGLQDALDPRMSIAP
jgi:hypothetical protein